MMKKIKPVHILILSLAIPIFCGCDKLSSNEIVVKDIVSALEEQPQQYFKVNFDIRNAKGKSIHQLEGHASLKMGTYGSISKAFFTVDGGDRMNFIHTISDFNTSICLLDSAVLEDKKASNLHDSINSPVKLHPDLLNEWYARALHVGLTNNVDSGFVNITFQLAQQIVTVSWDEKEQRLNTLELIDDAGYEYSWQFSYRTKAAFIAVVEANKMDVDNQNKEFL
jgi:hypothetical protein